MVWMKFMNINSHIFLDGRIGSLLLRANRCNERFRKHYDVLESANNCGVALFLYDMLEELRLM